METRIHKHEAIDAIENVLQSVRTKKTEEWFSSVKSRITSNDFLAEKPTDPAAVELLYNIYQELFDFAMDWDGLDMEYEGTFEPEVHWIDWTPENLGFPIKTCTKLLRHLEQQGLIYDLRIDYADKDSINMTFQMEGMNDIRVLSDFDSTYRDIKALLTSLDK